MDLGDVMRELGLDMFASSSVSSGSSGGDDGGPDGPEALEDVDAPEEPGVGSADPESEFEEFDESEPDPEPDDELDAQDRIMDQLDELSHQVDQLSSDVEDNGANVRALRSEREEMIERLDRIEENNATLLGVYDRLTNDINPFAADWDEKYDQKISEQDDQPYGVIEPPENEAEARAAARERADEEDEDDVQAEGLTFDDLKDKHEEGDESETEADDEAEEAQETDQGPDPTPDQSPGATATTAAHADGAGAVTGVPPRAGDEPYLQSLATTFATEVLMMEWLSMLIDVAGPAGAMKALDFYERIDWISPEIKRRLETMLSGAHDVEDVPSRPPSDLTAEEHNRSFAHIMRLAQQQGFAQTSGE
mgnify:CR=1 FL=1